MNNMFKQSNSDISITVSPNPNEMYTNSKIKVYCTKNLTLSQINFVVEWKRINCGIQQVILDHENSAYQCSPFDLGCFIEAKIKYDQQGILKEQILRFGAIKLQPELVSLLQKTTILQPFKIKICIQNSYLDTIMKLSDDGITFISKQNFQFNLKTQQIPQINLKSDLRMINLKLKNYTQTMNRYLCALLKRSLKSKAISLDIIFQSRFKRDYFLMILKNFMKRKSSSSKYQRNSIQSLDRSDLNVSNTSITMKSRKNLQNTSLSLNKKKYEKQKLSVKQKSIIKSPSIHRNNSLNFDDNSSDILKDLQSSELFQDMKQKDHAILNLRDSFNLLEQKYMKQKISQSSFLLDDNSNPKTQLEKAKAQISKLKETIKNLTEQNQDLKVQLSQLQNLTKQITTYKQKILHLNNENQRLEGQRTKIIADKINMEIKYQKEKEEKDLLKQKLDKVLMTNQNFQKIEKLKPPYHFKSPSHFNINSPEILLDATEGKMKRKQSSPDQQLKISNYSIRRLQAQNPLVNNKY